MEYLDTSCNINTIMKYLGGNINHLSFTDTNHNFKNCCYQLVGGYCAAVIGFYCFDPWLLHMTVVAKYMIRVEEFFIDGLALWLASPSTIKKWSH